MRRAFLLFCLAGTLFAGCAADTRDQSLSRVRQTVDSRLGYDVARQPTVTLDDFVGDGTLDAEEAVRLALLNNADLQAELDTIGIASAELLQASLLPNPILNASVRFADEGEIIELGIAQNVLQLLLIPGRRGQATEALAMTEAEVAAAVLDLASQTRMAYRQYQAQLARVELYENVVDATYLAADMARRLREAGNVIELDVLQEQVLYSNARLMLAEAQGEAIRRREALCALLGVWGPAADEWTVPPRLPAAEPLGVDPATLVPDVVAASLDLEAQRRQINMIARQAGIRSFETLVPDVEIGVDAERETSGEWSVGPAGAVGIPIFNFGKGVRAEYRARLSQAMNRYTATAVRLRAETRSAYTSAATTANTTRYLQEVLLPQRSQLTQQTQLQFNAMQLGVFQLLQAKRNEIETAERYLSALEDHWSARIRLETLRMGRMPQQRFGIDTGGSLATSNAVSGTGSTNGGH